MAGSVTSLMGLASRVPPTPWKAFIMPIDISSRIPVPTSRGKRMSSTMMLKKSWTVAAANARWYSEVWRMWPSETMVFVTVVPTLAPMTM